MKLPKNKRGTVNFISGWTIDKEAYSYKLLVVSLKTNKKTRAFMEIKSYKDLIVWQKAIEVSKKIYLLTKSLPLEELYGLCSQMRRAAILIASNIAEGGSRGTRKDFIQFLRIASSSTAELQTQIVIAKEFYPNASYVEIEALLIEIEKMLSSMIKKLKANS